MTRDESGDAAVELRDVTFAYARGGPLAVDGVRLRIEVGELVAIAGPNGSGKTTVARLISGLLVPSSGVVLTDGLDTARHPVHRLAAHVGYAFQDPGTQLFARTVAEELAFGPRNLGLGEDEVRARVAVAASRLGLTETLEAHPRRLGPGPRKLVSIAAVLTLGSPILVLDEPTAGQDHRTAGVVIDLMRDLRRDGHTIVCVTHDTTVLAEAAERIVVLAGGRLVADGSPGEVFGDEGALGEAGLEPPPVTRLARRLGVETGNGPVLSVAAFAERFGRVPAGPEGVA